MVPLADTLTTDEIMTERLRCWEDAAYFIDNYVQIYDPKSESWIPFHLWGFQFDVLDALEQNNKVIILKARQLGLSWLCEGYILWRALCRPIAAALLFSKREEEAKHILERIKDMHMRLPDWLQLEVTTDNTERWELSNGSSVRAFNSGGGDSYAATIVMADEFDLIENQGKLLRGAKPTIDNGGRMILLSRVDKDRPQTEFKNIYKAARKGESDWKPIFLPWNARPDRTPEWYEAQKADSLSTTGSLDTLYEQYPASVAEALAPRVLGKRIPPAWLLKCYQSMEPLALTPGAPSIPDLHIYSLPARGQEFVIGADPAEGNPTSDDSAATVIDKRSGEEVASLAGKFEPSVFAAHLQALSLYFNNANILVERNNHGHAVLLWLRDNGSRSRILAGRDGKAGWMSSTLGKSLLYDTTADAYKNGETTLHSEATFNQLSSIEGATLRAPEGESDDLSDSDALALQARLQKPATIEPLPDEVSKSILGW